MPQLQFVVSNSVVKEVILAGQDEKTGADVPWVQTDKALITQICNELYEGKSFCIISNFSYELPVSTWSSIDVIQKSCVFAMLQTGMVLWLPHLGCIELLLKIAIKRQDRHPPLLHACTCLV